MKHFGGLNHRVEKVLQVTQREFGVTTVRGELGASLDEHKLSLFPRVCALS